MLDSSEINEAPNIVFGRLLESVHISGYSFQRVCSELEWLLQDERWKGVGPGYGHINEFLADIDLSDFNMGIEERRGLVQRLTDLKATQRPIANALGVSHKTIDRDLDAVSGDTPADSSPLETETEPAPNVSHDTPAILDYSAQIPNEKAEPSEEPSPPTNGYPPDYEPEPLPFMATWPEYRALEAQEYVGQIPQEEHGAVTELLSQPGIPVESSLIILQNLAAKDPEERQSIYDLNRSSDPYARKQALAQAADKPLMPDERLPFIRRAIEELRKAERLSSDAMKAWFQAEINHLKTGETEIRNDDG